MLLDNSILMKLKKSLLIRASRYSLESQKTNKQNMSYTQNSHVNHSKNFQAMMK